MKNNIDQLSNVLYQLSQIELGEEQDMSIVADTGFDEASIIATEDSVLSFVKYLVTILVFIRADGKETSDDIEKIDDINIDGYTSNNIKKYFDELSDVWPVEICVVKNEESLKNLLQLYKN